MLLRDSENGSPSVGALTTPSVGTPEVPVQPWPNATQGSDDGTWRSVSTQFAVSLSALITTRSNSLAVRKNLVATVVNSEVRCVATSELSAARRNSRFMPPLQSPTEKPNSVVSNSKSIVRSNALKNEAGGIVDNWFVVGLRPMPLPPSMFQL